MIRSMSRASSSTRMISANVCGAENIRSPSMSHPCCTEALAWNGKPLRSAWETLRIRTRRRHCLPEGFSRSLRA
jgi:hypothetical protein